jgi:DNA-binding CsgD family transcriptional regulator/tetratricopeptide (TPR) repeat protein
MSGEPGARRTEPLERETLLAALEAARDRGRLVFVGGEAGVGKTTLVEAFAARCPGPVLRGSCENLATPTPLGPVVDIAAELGGSLARVVESGATAREVARALLAELGPPSVVVLEDLHWADEATLDALRVVGRRIEPTGALVLATYRDDEVEGEHPLRIVLGELASTRSVSRLSVPRLSVEAVRRLAEPYGADGDAIHRLTLGNAFYATEILASGGELLPATVRDAVLARIAVLGPCARRLLDVVAVVPSRVELWLLESVAPAELLQLDVCVAAGVLREDGGAVAFRHELARLACESAVPPNRRRALHAALVQALASPPHGSPDVSRLAHHADAAADSAAVLEYAPAAARLASSAGAHREAAEQYERTLRNADRLGVDERARLLDAYSRETYLTGRYAETIAALLEAIALHRARGDSLAEGDALARLPMPYISAGRNAEAEAAGRDAVELLETLPLGRALANAYAAQAYLRMLDRDNADGVFWGEKAVAAADALGDRETLSFGLNMIGTSLVMAGEVEQGVDHLLRSLDVARSDGLELRIGSALGMLGSGLGEMYELEQSERYLREHIAFADEHDLWPLYSRSWLALVEVYRGRWDEGTARAQAVLVQSPEAISRISALIALGRVRARRGDPGATEVLDEALELSLPGGHLQRLGHVHAARAEAAWLADDRERAVVEARAVYPLAVEKRHLWFAGELAYWRWKGGDLDRKPPDWIAEPYRLQLAGSSRAAAEAWSARGCSYESARSLVEAEDEGGLVEALSVLEGLGAVPAARDARRRLREIGVAVPRGPRPTTRANPRGLTARELEVLQQVAAGRRNADIAADLVVSVRTVDHHVAAILRKLDVHSRGEAAAAAATLGLLGGD